MATKKKVIKEKKQKKVKQKQGNKTPKRTGERGNFLTIRYQYEQYI